MNRTYKLKQCCNKGKLDKIEELLFHYRKLARSISLFQWDYFHNGSNYKFNKNLDIKKLETCLSERYKQTCQYQIVSTLDSFILNVQNRYVKIVFSLDLDDETRKKLNYLNKYKKWYSTEIRMQGKLIEPEILLLSRQIIRYILKKFKKPSFKNINMNLDNKVAVIENKNIEKAINFDYWVKLSTVEKGNPIYLPIQSNNYYESKKGDRNNFIQINKKEDKIDVCFIKSVSENQTQYYDILHSKISFDIGLVCLITVSYMENGIKKTVQYGRKFYSKLQEFDNRIQNLQRRLQQQGLELGRNKKYIKIVQQLKSYIKNEINRILNLIVKKYRPGEIVIESLNFHRCSMSRRMNRLIRIFGLGQIKTKLEMLKEDYGIKVDEINCAYTSQECDSCHYVDARNRKEQKEFKCLACGFKANADSNGSNVVFGRSSIEDLKDKNMNRKSLLKILVTRYLDSRNIPIRGGSSDSSAIDYLEKHSYLRSNPYFKEFI